MSETSLYSFLCQRQLYRTDWMSKRVSQVSLILLHRGHCRSIQPTTGSTAMLSQGHSQGQVILQWILFCFLGDFFVNNRTCKQGKELFSLYAVISFLNILSSENKMYSCSFVLYYYCGIFLHGVVHSIRWPSLCQNVLLCHNKAVWSVQLDQRTVPSLWQSDNIFCFLEPPLKCVLSWIQYQLPALMFHKEICMSTCKTQCC